YAINSTNSSGQCCSIRWFLPLLAPGYFVLALILRERVSWRPAFYILSGWGAVLTTQMLGPGPWMQHMVPNFWQIQAAAAGTLLILMAMHRLSRRPTVESVCPPVRLEGKAA